MGEQVNLIKILLLAASLECGLAFADTPSIFGAISGGGGKGVVCRDDLGSIQSVELLDLWEARTLFGQVLVPSTGSLQGDVDRAVAGLKFSYYFNGSGGFDEHGPFQGQEYVEAYLRLEASHFLQPYADLLRLRGIILTLTDDSYELAKPANCAIEQLVNYLPTGRILLNQDLFDKMDMTSQAALITHEAYYAFLREMAGESTSIRARRAVGYVFGGEIFSLFPGVPRPGVAWCAPADGSTGTFMSIDQIQFPNNKPGFGVTFQRMEGSQLVGYTSPQFEWKGDGYWSPMADILSGKCTNAFEASFGLGFLGPVEYDRDIKLTWDCRGRKQKVFLTSVLPGQSGAKTIELKCRR